MSDTSPLDERLIAAVWNGELAGFSPELFRFFAEDFLKAVRTAFEEGPRKMPMWTWPTSCSDDLFRMAMEQNLFHFSAAKTLAEIQELNRLFRESGNFE